MDKYQTRINRDSGIQTGTRHGTDASTAASTEAGKSAGHAVPRRPLDTAARIAQNDSGQHAAIRALAHATRNRVISAIAVAGSALAMSAFALNANAEITEDCVLEGTVDMRMAEQLGQPVYVRFRSAERGAEARCSLTRRSNSRRVQFISSPDEHDFDDASHGDRVRYRYTERDGNPGTWQLIEVRER